MEVRPNCPHPSRENLRGYYAHVSSLDDQLGRLWRAMVEDGLMENTIFCFTSDHGDMLGSQNVQTKQHPWDESILVPFVLTAPAQSEPGMRIVKPFNVVDILPTLLGLAEVPVPATVEGLDHSPEIRGDPFEGNEASFIMSIAPFSDPRLEPWRGVRTGRYTYVRKLDGYKVDETGAIPYTR